MTSATVLTSATTRFLDHSHSLAINTYCYSWQRAIRKQYALLNDLAGMKKVFFLNPHAFLATAVQATSMIEGKTLSPTAMTKKPPNTEAGRGAPINTRGLIRA